MRLFPLLPSLHFVVKKEKKKWQNQQESTELANTNIRPKHFETFLVFILGNLLPSPTLNLI
jgi:hypothetical protein